MAEMTASLNQSEHSGRGPSRPRSRFRIGLACALLLPLASCGAFGPGIAGLPSAQGWAPLPLRDWLIEDTFRPHTVVICRADACPAPAMVAVFEASGPQAEAYARMIAQDPARLIQRPASTEKPALRKASKPAKKPAHPGSITRTERLTAEGLQESGHQGQRITVTSKSANAKTINAVILQKRHGDRLTFVLAVTADRDNALAFAKAGIGGVW
ncbi:MAG: hypothetical protein ACRC56_05280 [Bosea sp. (in: a-proteobacteria)]